MIDNKTQHIVLLVIIAGLLLVTPSIIRYFNDDNYAISGETYNSIRLNTQDNYKYDILQGRMMQFNILNLIQLDGIAEDIFFSIIPTILGLLSIVLAYHVLHKHNISEKTILVILILAVVSPIFIYTFMDFKNYPFIIFFNILGMYFSIRNKTLLSGISFGIVPLIDAFSGIVTIALLLIYSFNSDHKRNSHNRMLLVGVLFSTIISLVLSAYNGYSLSNIFSFYMHNILTDIGALIGVSFAIIILTIIGLILLWENGWRTLTTYIMILMMLALGLFNDTIRIYMNFVVMIYAGFALIYLNKRKWSIQLIKKTTILLIICSIFFSSLVYTTKIIRSEPTDTYIEALMTVKNQALPTEVILSSPQNGYMIEYYTNRTVFIDESSRQYNPWKYEIMENISISRNLERTESMLQKYNIKYIVIDKEFEQYLEEREGLLFLMETSGKFTHIFINERVNVWMYTS
ncbi:MAG TPA: hypothetical protein VEC16_02330 [Alphaproteobacteria bacterium]|nr:hypothetical protein [Alphaproteobacteria bacterium]